MDLFDVLLAPWAQVDVRRKAPKKGKAAIAAFHQYDPLNYSTAPPPLFSFNTTKDSYGRGA